MCGRGNSRGFTALNSYSRRSLGFVGHRMKYRENPGAIGMPELTRASRSHSNRTPSTRAGQGWCMPRPVRRFGGRLMEQQVWCWGRDVEYPDGNLLMQYGFERHRDSDTADRSTCYRLDHDDLHICLWGFGMFFGSRELGGLYLDRFDFCPTWAPVESLSSQIHWPDELPPSCGQKENCSGSVLESCGRCLYFGSLAMSPGSGSMSVSPIVASASRLGCGRLSEPTRRSQLGVF